MVLGVLCDHGIRFGDFIEQIFRSFQSSLRHIADCFTRLLNCLLNFFLGLVIFLLTSPTFVHIEHSSLPRIWYLTGRAIHLVEMFSEDPPRGTVDFSIL
jgi:hypothetical protein